MEYLQNALNRYRVELNTSLEKNSDMPQRTKKRGQKNGYVTIQKRSI